MKNEQTNSLRIFIAIAMLFIVGFSVNAQDFSVDGIFYNVTSATEPYEVEVTSGDEYSGDVIIPESVTYNDIEYSVTAIGYHAFFESSGLTSIEMPNSITEIGDEAFSGCSGLTSIEIPNSVTSIGYIAFGGCSGLTSIEIPNSITYISEYAFCECTSITRITIPNSITEISACTFMYCTNLTTVVIPNSVTSIGSFAFYNCPGLTDIVIPNSVTSIGGAAFSGCTSLTSIMIPNSVTEIGDVAFYGCSGLTSIVVDEGNPVYDSRENCNAIIETASNCLIAGCQNSFIPNSVTTIGDYAFYECAGLISIVIPNSVTAIGVGAFSSCSDLTSIEIPNSVTSISNYAFTGCTGLTSIVIPNSVTSIGKQAFGYCSGLTNIVIPNSVTEIGDNAFFGCDGLTSIIVEEGNPVYDSRENCNAIIETASNELIAGCQNSFIPNSTTAIGYTAFSNCDGLTSIEIPNSVTEIGDWAFWNCTGLTSIVIPNSVTSIGGAAFSGCSGLASIEIPNSVTSIGDQAFWDCSGLTSITIPNSIESMGVGVFWPCHKIKDIYMQSESVPTAYDTSNFDSELDKSNVNLYVPIGSASLYEAANGWNEFNIVEYNYNNFEINNIEAYKGTTIDVPVILNNINDITAFQCNLHIPNGLSVTQSDGLYDITLTDRKGIDHQLTATLQQDGSIKLLCYSLRTLPFSNNEGALFYIRINIDEEAVGEHQIRISNIILTSTSTKYSPNDCEAIISVKDYINGDANEDLSVDVMDIVYIAQFILGNSPSDFLSIAGDYNKDGDIDVFDIVNIASAILNENVAYSVFSNMTTEPTNEPLLQLSAKLNDSSITVGVDSNEIYSAFQLDIYLPDGIEITDIKANDANTHTLVYNAIGNRVRVLCYSINSAELCDNTNLFSIELKSTANTTDNIVIKNSIFSDSKGNGCRAALKEIGTTGIEQIANGIRVYSENGKIIIESDEASKAELFSLDGSATLLDIAIGRNEIAIPNGIYVIRINNQTFKLII